MKRQQYIDDIKKVLKSTVPDAEVILYGSEARGDAKANSDIDLLILVDRDKLDYQEEKRITEPLYALELKDTCSVSISPLVMTRKAWYDRPVKTPFYINVMNEGYKIL